MHNNLKRYKTLGIALILTLTTFFLCNAGLFLLWLLLQAVNISSNLWAMIEALMTAAGAAAVVGAAYIAHKELNELTSSRHLDVADKLFHELNSPENIAARRWVYQTLPDDVAAGRALLGESPAGLAAFKQVLNSLDRVAFLTQRDWIPEEMVMAWMNPMIVKAWVKVEPYIHEESRQRQEADYYVEVRFLAEHCILWRAGQQVDLAPARDLLAALDSKAFRQARRWIFQNLPDASTGAAQFALPASGKKAVSVITSTLKQIDSLLESSSLDEEKIMPWIATIIVRSWDKILPYVAESEVQSANRLVAQCRSWRQRGQPDAEIVWDEKAI